MIELMRERITIQKSSTKTDKTGNHMLVWEDYYNVFPMRTICPVRNTGKQNRSMRKQSWILLSGTAVRCQDLIRSITVLFFVEGFIILHLLITCSTEINQ